jgi:hypothetical protein
MWKHANCNKFFNQEFGVFLTLTLLYHPPFPSIRRKWVSTYYHLTLLTLVVPSTCQVWEENKKNPTHTRSSSLECSSFTSLTNYIYILITSLNPCVMHRCVCIWRYILQNYNYKLHFQNLSTYHIPDVSIGTLAAKILDVCTTCDPRDINIQLTMVKDRGRACLS